MRSRLGCYMLPVFLTLARIDAGAFAQTTGGGFDRAISVVGPRVVKLYGLRAGRESGFGSGIIVSEDGLVLTVFSLLIDARRIRVVTADGLLLAANVVHQDRKRQIALVQLRPVSEQDVTYEDHEQLQTGLPAESGHPLQLPFFDLAVDTPIRPGDWVVAAGNAFKVAEGAEQVSLVHGVFSARTRLDARRRLKDFPYRGDVLVIDAITSNPGAPGGALVNLDGKFVGMIGREVISNLTHTHFNYAIPRDVLYECFLEARAAGSPHSVAVGANEASVSTRDRPEPSGEERLADAGMRMSPVGYKRVLPFVERVRRNSPASKAGVRKDDLILSVNGRGTADMAALMTRLTMLRSDEPMDFVLRRGTRILSVRIKTKAATMPQGVEPKEHQ